MRPTLLLLLLFGYHCPVAAQLMQIAPEYISDMDLVLEDPPALLAAQGIGRTQSFNCPSGKCGTKKWELQHEVIYDPQGYPIEFRNGAAMRAEADEKSDLSERFGRRWEDACTFRFHYGPAHELIAVEKCSWDGQYSRDEELVQNTYDAQGRLTTQQHTTRLIYRPGYTYRSTAYPNDTAISILSFSYDQHGLATCVRQSDERARTDTLFTAAALDTILYEPDSGYVADHVSEQLIPIGHALLLGGICAPQYGAHTACMRSTFINGRLATNDIVLESGAIVSHTVFRYADSGLLEAVEDGEGNRLRYLVHSLASDR